MKRLLLKSMILKATVTQADIQYVGSITIDQDLIDHANLSEHENVHVIDRTNGRRLETYVIRGERGSGVICMNGAAAHKANIGDLVIIMSFCALTPEEAERHQPRIAKIGKENKIIDYAKV